MFARRAVYTVFLTASFFYYIFHTTYVSWVLFVLAIALPILSITLTLLLTKGRHRIALACSTRQADLSHGFTVSLKMEPASQAVSGRLRLEFENLFSGETSHCTVNLSSGKPVGVPYQDDTCGVVRVRAKRTRIVDLLGIIGLPIAAPRDTEVLLLPEERSFRGDPDALFPHENVEWQIQAADGRLPTREWKEIRDYRQGDMLRDVHWKLTARRGRIVVREYEAAQASKATIAVLPDGRAEHINGVISRLLGVVRHFLEAEYSLALLWLEQKDGQDELREFVVADETAFTNMLKEILGSHHAGGGDAAMRRLLTQDSLQAGGWLLVSPGSVAYYHGNKLEEELG